MGSIESLGGNNLEEGGDLDGVEALDGKGRDLRGLFADSHDSDNMFPHGDDPYGRYEVSGEMPSIYDILAAAGLGEDDAVDQFWSRRLDSLGPDDLDAVVKVIMETGKLPEGFADEEIASFDLDGGA